MGTPRQTDQDRPDTEDVVGTLCIDGQPLTASDIERTVHDRATRIEQIRRAVLTVAYFSRDRSECEELLAMLGFENEQLVEIRDDLRVQRAPEAAKAS